MTQYGHMTIFPGGSEVKASACNVGDLGSISGSGSSPGEGEWQPTPVFLPGESQGRRSLVGFSSWGRQESDTTERLHFHALEKEMATHSSVLAWRIPGTGSLVGCRLWGCTELDMTEATQQQQQRVLCFMRLSQAEKRQILQDFIKCGI